jgi:hypothetical protein
VIQPPKNSKSIELIILRCFDGRIEKSGETMGQKHEQTAYETATSRSLTASWFNSLCK